MSSDDKKHPFKRIILRAAKFPLALLVAGLILVALSYLDDIFSLSQWKHVLDISDEMGDILFALAIMTFVYSLIVLACRKYERKFVNTNLLFSLILGSIRKSLRIIFILVAIDVIVAIAGPTQLYFSLANNALNVFIIATIGWVAIQVLYTSEAVLYKKMQTQPHVSHVRVKALYTKMHILRNIATVIIIILTIAVILMSFSSVRNIGISLLASAGFLTAIIGLAAQRTLFSLFAGLQIAFSQPIKIGDIVVVEKESGIVEEITLTYVTLKLGDRRRLIIPINYFIEKPFENWSHEGHSVRNSIFLYVDFMMPIDPLRAELDKILETAPLWDKNAKKLQVTNMNDRAVEVRIQVSASNADNLADLRAEVREKMLIFIQKHYPQFFPNVHLTNFKPHEIETDLS